ncbi:MAG: exosortase O [Anaerolineales bacterium]
MLKHIQRLRNQVLTCDPRELGASRGRAVLANLALFGLWLWLYRGVYPYLAVIFTRQEFRTNQVVLLGVLVLLGMQLRRSGLHLRWDALPQLYPPALVLTLGASISYLLSERYLDVNTLSASLFGLGSYGMLGLWMNPRRWRAGFPAALLLVGALPFGEHMQTFIGYPVRVFTAQVVGQGLARLGVPSIGVDTILVFESGLTQVDLPCSGVKSLWTGGLFLIAATWIERRKIGVRWILVAIVFSAALLAANLVRVAVLVGVGQAAGLRLLAEMLHVPLGVLGFVGACAGGIWLLRRVVPTHVEDLSLSPGAFRRPAWLSPALAGAVLALALLYSPRPQPANAGAPPQWDFPSELAVEPWPFTPGEQNWLERDGAGEAERWRFRWRDLSGSMLFVTSSTWREQHRPESCFAVYGLSIDSSRVFMAAPDLPVRLVSLGDERGKDLYSAAYWFQSTERATDEYAARIWADLAPERQTWVLVTLLFDGNHDPSADEAAELYQALRNSVQRKLAGVNLP